MTTELTKAAQQALEALESASNGLTWYQQEHPEDDSPADEEMHEALNQAMRDLREALTQRPAAQTERGAFESAARAKWGPLDFERSEAVPEMYYNQRLDDAWIGFGFAVAWLRASLPTPRHDEDEDGDVTGQPGPLPETGWDEVPEGAFRKPSPTAGMNLGERIKHVGGRENAAGYIEFGSVAAVRALVRQYLRDLPASQQATPETLTRFCPGCGSVGEVPDSFRDCCPDGAKARLIPASLAHHCRDLFILALGAAKESATPEPVGEAIIGRWLYEKWWAEYGKLADVDKPYYTFDELPEKQRAAYESLALMLTHPAPGVPEDVRAALEFYASGNHFVRADADAWETVSGEPPNFWEDEANTATVEDGTIARNALAALAAAQAKGAGHE